MWIIKWEDERIIMKWTYLLENLVRLIYWTRRSDSLYLRPICINWISMYYGYNIHSLDPSFKLNSNKGVSSKRFDWAKRRSDARLSRCLEVPVVDARGRQGPNVGPQSHRQYIIIVYMLKKIASILWIQLHFYLFNLLYASFSFKLSIFNGGL